MSNSALIRGVPSKVEGKRLLHVLAKYLHSEMYRKGALAEIKGCFDIRSKRYPNGRLCYAIELRPSALPAFHAQTCQAFLSGFLKGERYVLNALRKAIPKRKKK